MVDKRSLTYCCIELCNSTDDSKRMKQLNPLKPKTMNTNDILTLVGFAVFVMALPLFCAGLIAYGANRFKNLK